MKIRMIEYMPGGMSHPEARPPNLCCHVPGCMLLGLYSDAGRGQQPPGLLFALLGRLQRRDRGGELGRELRGLRDVEVTEE